MTIHLNQFRFSVFIAFNIFMFAIRGNAQATSQEMNAMILLQPVDAGTQVAMVFTHRVQGEKVKLLVNAFALGNSVQPTNVNIRDQEINGDQGKVIQTEASFTISAQANLSEGAFNLQPMLNSLKSLKAFDLLYYVRDVQGFHGLKLYKDANVSVQLLQAGGPYRYRFQIADPAKPMPQLPLFDAVTPPEKKVATDTSRNPMVAKLIGLVLLTLAVGITTWLGLSYISRRRMNNLAMKRRKSTRIAPPAK
ncbi:MAG: hypothetical protein ABJA67_09825 [Chthonomonadales bacterium]